ncbi:MAG: glycosyltransferase [Lachnospiraceae bacterium]|nr:glycosyltransferase [Lachnospiraceae bacterium]
MNDEIMVSVPMLVYNHEKTVARAIESILKQKTQYRYEIIVADDASTDNSPNIIREYARKYPDIIVPVLREKNLGMQDNNIETLKLCRGKYISGCEGDDYWLTEDKMEKQISFLENNPDYSACVTKCKFIVDGKEEPYPFASTDSLDIKDMLNKGEVKRYATCTIACRNVYQDNLNLLDYYRTGGVGDIVTVSICIMLGKIKYMDDVTGIYERLTKGNGSSFSEKRLVEQVSMIKKAIQQCKRLTGKKYDKYWNRYIAIFNRAAYYETKSQIGKKDSNTWYNELSFTEKLYLRRQLIIDYINYKRNR